ncbi:MAG TPA: alpha/beta hydrolase [Solirubrobacteraceae bacterium]|nr:alpha/beta hydrolase [Solirubrobacteraceae bacterium]
MSQLEPKTDIALPDGRRLSYLLTGADDGLCVTVLDGPCSRGLGRALAPTAHQLGIRLLIPDRPGAHGSTVKPGRRIADWPADQLALLDTLGIEQAGIVTQSGGTAYGIAVAAAAPGRVNGLALLGAMGPLTSRAARQAAGRQVRAATFLSRWAPAVLRAGLRRAYKTLPDSAISQVPPPDRLLLDDPFIRDIHLRTSEEVLGNPDGAIEEFRLLAGPWGITPPPSGRVPTALWTGELDPTHPPAQARRVAELLGGDPPVTIVPGAATFGLIGIFSDALRFATGR